MITAQDIQTWLTDAMDLTHIEVEGDGQHFFAVIVSTEFEQKNAIKRHQCVYGALGDKMVDTIHALSMKTMTPDEWEKSKQN